MATPQTSDARILRAETVADLIGASRSGVYVAVKRDGLPPPIRLGPNRVGWIAEEVHEWIDKRIEEGKAERENGS